MFDHTRRLARVQQAMAAHNIDLLFLNASTNLQYLTGIARDEPNYGNTMYPGEWLTGAWVPQQGAPILTLPRMLADFHLGAIPGYDVRVLPDAGDPVALAAETMTTLSVPPNAHIAVDDRSWAQLVLNVQKLRSAAELSLASAILAPLRRIKDTDELAIMRKAGEITEAAYLATLRQLKHGMTNLDLITEVNYQLRKHGSRTHSFVTSFYNMGREYPFDFSNREEVLPIPLEAPVSVSFDFGAVYEGYCYDYGRSVFFGEPDEEYRRVHALVMAARGEVEKSQLLFAEASSGSCAPPEQGGARRGRRVRTEPSDGRERFVLRLRFGKTLREIRNDGVTDDLQRIVHLGGVSRRRAEHRNHDGGHGRRCGDRDTRAQRALSQVEPAGALFDEERNVGDFARRRQCGQRIFDLRSLGIDDPCPQALESGRMIEPCEGDFDGTMRLPRRFIEGGHERRRRGFETKNPDGGSGFERRPRVVGIHESRQIPNGGGRPRLRQRPSRE